MVKKTQRKVKRQPAAGRQAMLSQYNAYAWYDLPDWAREFITGAIVWVVAFFVILWAPGALLAIVLGFHALPLEFLGVAASDNSAGLAVLMLLLKFIFLALAIRPLYRRERKGWIYLIAAASIHFVHSIVLHHAISGTLILLLTLYLYNQTKRRYQN